MIDYFFDVALPEATPSPFGTAMLLLAALGGTTRSAPRNKFFIAKYFFYFTSRHATFTVLPSNNKRCVKGCGFGEPQIDVARGNDKAVLGGVIHTFATWIQGFTEG